jgi:hypothetical protein
VAVREKRSIFEFVIKRCDDGPPDVPFLAPPCPQSIM